MLRRTAALSHLDTHVLVWLNAGLQYLYEIGRISESSDAAVTYRSSMLDLRMSSTQFQQVIGTATEMGSTRDRFYRLITAPAAYHCAELITADNSIRDNYERVLWG